MDSNPYQNFFDQYINELVEIRRELHRIAEVSNEEEQTAEYINKILKKAGADEIITGIGGYGVLGVFDSGTDGPSTLFRAELDGLPIPDEIKADYVSEKDGTGHKCGHDGHMANVIGLVFWLRDHPPEKGKLYVLFQPAEETGEGAARVLDDPAFKKIKPDRVVALHNLPGYEKHQVIVKKGIFTSASSGLTIRLKGSTSHAAHPEDGRSPAPAMTQIMDMLQMLPVHTLSETSHALVTIIHAKLGDVAFGTTPGKAVIMATLRAKATKDLDRMLKTAVKKAKKIAEVWDLEIETESIERFETTQNDAEVTKLLTDTVSDLSLKQFNPDHPFPWSEDFGRFTGVFPGVLFGLGAGVKHPQLHHRTYDYPDELIVTATSIFIDLKQKIHG